MASGCIENKSQTLQDPCMIWCLSAISDLVSRAQPVSATQGPPPVPGTDSGQCSLWDFILLFPLLGILFSQPDQLQVIFGHLLSGSLWSPYLSWVFSISWSSNLIPPTPPYSLSQHPVYFLYRSYHSFISCLTVLSVISLAPDTK